MVKLPENYGWLSERDYDLINIYVNGKYAGSTTWARTAAIARLAYAQKHRLPLYQVTAKKGN